MVTVNATFSKNKLYFLVAFLAYKWEKYINQIIIQINDRYPERAMQDLWVENCSCAEVVVMLRFQQ